MYTAKIKIGEKTFLGILDFYVIHKATNMFKKDNKDYTVHSLIKNLLDLDSKTIRVVLFESICRLNNIGELEFERLFLKLSDRELETATKNMIMFINELMDKCIPLNENSTQKEVMFIDELEEESQEDWDFNHMEYLWHSVLNRKECFWNITPKNLFSQLDIYKKVNKIEDASVNDI